MIATLSITNIVYFGIGQILAVTFRKSEACCVLNAVKVRATNLQELVYKNGQAGVTKATVSIMFDNSNKQQSPMGYEIYDEITVTRQVTIISLNNADALVLTIYTVIWLLRTVP